MAYEELRKLVGFTGEAKNYVVLTSSEWLTLDAVKGCVKMKVSSDQVILDDDEYDLIVVGRENLKEDKVGVVVAYKDGNCIVLEIKKKEAEVAMEKEGEKSQS
mgnify:CR=1 FL=1